MQLQGEGVIFELHSSNEMVSEAYALAPLMSVIHAGSGSLGLVCRRHTSGTSPSFCTYRSTHAQAAEGGEEGKQRSA